jgi:peptidoglycan/LPS O-acetylase OafA/YrhL
MDQLRLPHLPALDGLRGLAVIVVLLFHGGFSWARGGYLGVTTFFVLSGFLITALLLIERETRGSIDLRAFWARRARRLAPALLLMVGIVLAYAGTLRYTPSELVGDAIGTLMWVANWRFVFSHQSYGALFGQPSPFQHAWSLGVEEQFYLVLPVAAVLLLGWRGPLRRWRFGIVVAAGVVASTIAAALLHDPGAPAGHAYFGTDARAAEPLVGVLLALLLIKGAHLREFSGWPRRLVGLAGIAGVCVLIALFTRLSEHSDALYRGGFLVTALASAAALAACAQAGSLLSRVFSNTPLVGLGRISYGVYLFHWPVFLWLSPARTELPPGPLFLCRTGVTLAISVVSYFLVEQPIREGRLPGRVAVIGWANASVALVAAVLVISTPAPTVATLLDGSAAATPPPPPVVVEHPPPTMSASAVRAPTASPPTRAAGTTKGAAATAAPAGSENPEPAAPPPTTPVPTVRIAVVGDSMADGLAAGLSAWGKARGDVAVYGIGQPGCPLARGGIRRLPDGRYLEVPKYCSWWADQSSDTWQNLMQFAPDVVLIQDGMNEIIDRKLPTWPTWRRPGDPQYDTWLLDEYTQVVNAFSSSYPVVFLNAACADWDIYDEGTWTSWSDGEGDFRVGALDRTDAAAAATTGAVLGDLNAHLCPNGRYSSTVDGVSDARPDGYHLSPEASEVVAERWLGPLALQAASSR